MNDRLMEGICGGRLRQGSIGTGAEKGYGMAEIKSTLDLVMERTRHLTLSEEEKQQQALAEFKKNLAGLILKFQDSAISLDRLKRETDLLREASGIRDSSVLVAEIAGRLDLEKENDRVLLLLKELCGADSSGIASVLGKCSNALRQEREALVRRKSEELDKLRGISGSAVMPNPDAATDWCERRLKILNEFRDALKTATESL
jgi:hypothetical protein